MAKKTVRPQAVAKPDPAPAPAPAKKTRLTGKELVKKWWFWLIAAILVVAIALTLACTLDYTIMSHIIRLGCAPKNVSTPTGYADIVGATDAVYNVRYGTIYADSYMDVFSPKTEGKKPLLVYVHGGYYLGGDKASAEPYCRAIAADGYVVASLNYAVAPELQYPGQVRQFNQALNYLVEHASDYGIDLNNVFFGGDSAGCHLVSEMGAAYTNPALATALGITSPLPGERIRGLLLVCGFFNFKNVRQTKFPFVNTAMWAFVGRRDYENYFRAWELCTTETATANYPASLFLCAQDDKFLSQSKEFEGVLKDLGVYTESYYPSSGHKMGHEFARNFDLPEAYTALEKAKAFLSDRTVKEEADVTPHVKFLLSTGDEIDVTLYKRYAPATVENFLRYAESGAYDGTTFHRIISGEVLQGGGFTREGNTLTAIPEKYDPIYGEFADNGFTKNTLSHVAGTISMARGSAYDTATSQFFFCAQDCLYYDGMYAAFGQITDPDDLAVVQQLVGYELTTGGGDGMPKQNVYIVQTTVYYV